MELSAKFSLTRLETFCDSCSSDLTGLLDAKSGSGPLDMAEVIGWYASDVVGELDSGSRLVRTKLTSKPLILLTSTAGLLRTQKDEDGLVKSITDAQHNAIVGCLPFALLF
jgi:hypothetical protein